MTTKISYHKWWIEERGLERNDPYDVGEAAWNYALENVSPDAELLLKNKVLKAKVEAMEKEAKSGSEWNDRDQWCMGWRDGCKAVLIAGSNAEKKAS